MEETIPTRIMKREFITPISLRDLFEKDDEGEYIRFNNTIRYDEDNLYGSELEYRIPDHQRTPKWDKIRMRELIDTVFMGLTMSGIILSEYYTDRNRKYNIEDGQTRLSILQQFHNGDFQYKGKYFNDLKENEKNRFLSYLIPREVLIKCENISYEEHESYIHETFERLQSGKSLSDADKLWNRKDKSIVEFAFSLIQNYNNDDNYFNTKKFSTKKRGILPEFVAIICSILFIDDFGEKEYLTAYRFQHKFVTKKILTDEQKEKVYEFCNYYLDIINLAYTIKPVIDKEKKFNFHKCNKFWGTILIDYIDDSTTLEYKKNMWSNIINITRVSDDFMNTVWNGLKKGDKQNTTKIGIQVRLKRMKDFYNNKNTISNEHGIKYIDI
tara:strand:- start:344 stop:1495 length:1152 start_codon:yes stop_codon:yes gene_type:complete